MSKYEKHPDKFTSYNASENTKNLWADAEKSKLRQNLRRLNGLHFIAGLSQVILGSVVILIAVLGFIQPLWVGTLLSVLASAVVMTGSYFCYSAVASLSTDTLLREAMRRIMEAQN